MATIKTSRGAPPGEAASQQATRSSSKLAGAHRAVYYALAVLLVANILPMMDIQSAGRGLVRPARPPMHLVASAFSVGRFGWPGLEWREIIDWWTSGYSRGEVIGRNYIPPCKLCDMPRMFRVDK